MRTGGLTVTCKLRVVAAVLLLFLPFSVDLLAQTAGEELNLGVQAYKRSRFEEAIQHMENLHKALKLRPDYDDAMAYMNLMYRERADIQCDDPAARAADLKTADEWVDKTMATKKAKAEKGDRGAGPPATTPQ
jgi:hypothetical protein